MNKKLEFIVMVGSVDAVVKQIISWVCSAVIAGYGLTFQKLNNESHLP